MGTGLYKWNKSFTSAQKAHKEDIKCNSKIFTPIEELQNSFLYVFLLYKL